MGLHTIIIVTVPALEICRTVPCGSPDGLQLVPVFRRRPIDGGYADRRLGGSTIIDVDVDRLIVRVGREGLGDGRGAFRHEQLDHFPVLSKVLDSLELIQSL